MAKLRCAWGGSENPSASTFLQKWSICVLEINATECLDNCTDITSKRTTKRKAKCSSLSTHDTLWYVSLPPSPPSLFTSAAVPTHWHHRPTQLVWPLRQYCGVKRGRRWWPHPKERGNRMRKDWRGQERRNPLPRSLPQVFVSLPVHGAFEGTACWGGGWKILDLHLF